MVKQHSFSNYPKEILPPPPRSFFGRTEEINQLEEKLLQSYQLILLWGMSGIGKTALIKQFAHKVKTRFDYIRWYDISTPKPLGDLLTDILKSLPPSEQNFTSDMTLEIKMSLLVEQLTQNQCLLILDGMYSIVNAIDNSNTWNEHEYKDYNLLLKAIINSSNKSCMLLTCNNPINDIEGFNSINDEIYTMLVQGLKEDDAQNLLRNELGFECKSTDIEKIALHYGGHPYALKVVGKHFKENQSDFLNFVEELKTPDSDPYPFGNDIEKLLERHLKRLTKSDEESILGLKLVHWLIINREPTTRSILQDDTGFSSSELDKAINFLQSYFMIMEQKIGDMQAYFLHNTFRSYITKKFISELSDELLKFTPTSGNSEIILEKQDLDLFKNYPLVKAQSKNSIRNIQIKQIILPICEKLKNEWGGKEEVKKQFRKLLSLLQNAGPAVSKYSGVNIFSMLCYLDRYKLNKIQENNSDIDYNFLNLRMKQVYLQGLELNNAKVNFAKCELTHAIFTQTLSCVSSVAFSPRSLEEAYNNKKLLAVGDYNGQIYLYRVEDGLLLSNSTRDHHKDWVLSIAFAPDGKTLASSSADGKIILWKIDWDRVSQSENDNDSNQPIPKLKEIKTLPVHNTAVTSLSFSTDSNLLASGSTDTTIKITNLVTNDCQTLEGHELGVTSVTFHPLNDKLLASSSLDKTIRIWNLETNTCYPPLQGHTNWVAALAFSPDGQILASGSDDKSIKLWKMTDSNQFCLAHSLDNAHEDWIRSIALTPDGKTLASGCGDGTWKLWDVERRICLKSIAAHRHWIWEVAFSSDGQFLATGSADNSAKVWDVNSGSCLKAFEGYTNVIHSVAFSSDGKILVSCSDDQKIRLWDVEQGECLQLLEDQNSQVRSVIFSPNDAVLASCGLDSKIKLWYRDSNGKFSTDKLREISQKLTSWASSIAFSPDGKMLASGGADFHLHLWEVDIQDPDDNNYPKLSEIEPSREDLGHCRNHWIRSVAFSPDGNRIAIGSADQTIKIWIWNAQEHKYEFETNLSEHQEQVLSIAFSHDSKILVSGSADKTVIIWDIATAKCLYKLAEHQARVLSVAVSPDGIIASGSDDKTVILWDIFTGNRIMNPLNHNDWVRSVAFSTQRILASGSEDGTIELWNVDTGSLLRTLKIPKPYEGLNITGASGLTAAQKEALKALGAVENEQDNSKLNSTEAFNAASDTFSLSSETNKQDAHNLSEPQSQKKDFFISYNKADKNWAEWIAWTLEEEGYSVVIQAWDFRPGGNFILDMQRATEDTERTIAVLSEDYLSATYTQPEWAAAFKRDPQSEKRIMIPIRVRECQPTGLLGPIVYIDLVGLSQQSARDAILEALKERAKPIQAPAFPGGSRDRVTSGEVRFPG